MVQVDIVWAYAFGASFAAASARQLEKEDKPFNNKYYVFILLFLAIFFAPSGIYLLWQFPQWETMQVATCRGDIPAWLVVIFSVTNITQGILGYWTTYKLAQKGKYYLCHANWMVAWIIFWFILVCGWDCTGYQRFLYDASVNGGVLWAPGKHMGLTFFYASNVWWTLVVMALFFAPMLIRGFIKFTKDGLRMDASIPAGKRPGILIILAAYFATQWGVCLALAIAASLLVMLLRNITGSILLGYVIGLPAFGVISYFLLFRKKMPMYQIAKLIFVKESSS